MPTPSQSVSPAAAAAKVGSVMITDTGLYDTGTCEESQGGRLYARVVSLQLSTITNRERYMVNMAKDYFVSVGCTFIYRRYRL